MRNRIYLPEQVKNDIHRHFTTACQEALATFDSAADDEDTMTGHLGSKLEVGMRSVPVDNAEIGGNWKWTFRYYKFRGRGTHAPETYLGADGIFVLQVHYGARIEAKSLLFQAKMDTSGGRDLASQCIKLSTWREAAFIAQYTQAGFFAVHLDSVIRHLGGKASFRHSKPLADYLGGDFLDCRVGDNELCYDARKHQLMWRAHNGEFVGTQFSVGHRIGIDVYPPKHRGAVPRVIQPEEVYNYRMNATPEEILSLGASVSSASETKQAKQQLALSYHPDRFSEFDTTLQSIINRRMQEVNSAYDEIKRRK